MNSETFRKQLLFSQSLPPSYLFFFFVVFFSPLLSLSCSGYTDDADDAFDVFLSWSIERFFFLLFCMLLLLFLLFVLTTYKLSLFIFLLAMCCAFISRSS